MRARLRTENIRAARPHCVCVQVQNYDYDQAAEKLGCKRRFLEDRISEIPHQKIGESVAFCDCDLRIVQAMCTQIPEQVRKELADREAQAPTPAPSSGVRSLRDARPAGARRPRAERAAP